MWNDDQKFTRLVVVTAFLLAFYQYGLRDLTYFDEPRYAGIAREMAEAKSYVIPLLYGETYTEKPPLWFWCGMIAGKVLGFTSWAYFLVNVVSHFLTSLLVLDLGRRFGSARAGAIAMLAFAACPLALHYARSAQLDPLLAFGVTLVGWGSLRALDGGTFLHGAAAAVGFAIATLVKGHIGLFGLLAPLAYAHVYGNWRALLRPLRALAYLSIALAPFALWFSAVVAELGWERAVDVYFRRQIVERTAGNNHYSPWPVGPEYLASLALMIPLTFFLPGALARAGGHAGSRIFRIVAVTMFTIFALVPSKRELYLMPLVPWVALLAGDHLARIAGGERTATGFERGATIALVVLIALAGLGVVVLPVLGDSGLSFPGLGIDGPLLAAASAVGGLLAWSAWRRRDPAAPVALLLLLAVVSLFAEPVLARAANARFGWHAFGDAAQAAIPEREPVYVFAFTKAHAPQYFTRRKFVFVDELPELLARIVPGKECFVITREKGAKQLKRVEGLNVKKITDDGREFDDRTMLYAVRLASGRS